MTSALSESLPSVLQRFPLPALPHSAIRLLEMSRDPNLGPPEYALVLESDVGLVSQLLRFVNSSYFGFPRTISNVRQAVALVGVKTVLNFVLWSAVYEAVPRPRLDRFAAPAFWFDAIRRAVTARLLAQRMGCPDSEDVFVAALLQDVAVPLLVKHWYEEYQRVFPCPRDGGERLSQRERRQWNWTHAQAGQMLLDRWGLPSHLATWVDEHVNADRLLQEGWQDAGACVAVSALLPSVLDGRWHEFDTWNAVWERWQGLNSLREFLECVDVQTDDMARLLRIAVRANPLTASLPVVVGT